MNNNNTIPPITHELGRHWKQPDPSNILIDDTHAMMTSADFEQLPEYSCTFPSGVYEGKMWKRGEPYRGPRRVWYLMWYGQSEKPGFVSNNHRQIIICE